VRSFLQKIDALPQGPEWKWDTIAVEGDLTDANGKKLTEEAELWMRDPVECIKELIGNPLFKAYLEYAPYQVFRDMVDGEGQNREWDEAATGDEWRDLQVSNEPEVFSEQNLTVITGQGRHT
jgi:hypothetical protein